VRPADFGVAAVGVDKPVASAPPAGAASAESEGAAGAESAGAGTKTVASDPETNFDDSSDDPTA